GQPPFNGGMMDIIAHQLTSAVPPLCVRAPATPVWLAALVNMMLAKQPAQRPTMAQVVATLDGLTPRVQMLAHEGEDDDELVIEMTADMEEDEIDHELDQLIAELSPGPAAAVVVAPSAGPAMRRVALGS